MNSKQRVLKTISHEQPDRVPIGEWGIDHDHVSKILGRRTYWRNRRDTTLALWGGRRDEVVETMKADYVELIEKLDYDVIPLGLVPPKGYVCEDPPKEIEEGVWRDSAGRTFKYAASNDSIMEVTDPPAAKETISDEEVAALRDEWMDFDESRFELLDFIAEKYADTRALVFREMNTYLPLLQPFGGDEAHKLMMTLIGPDEIKKLHAPTIAYNRMLLDHCAEKGILICMQSKDWGTTNAPVMRPDSIADLFMPVSRSIAEYAKTLGMHPFFHSCGNIWDVLDLLVDAGLEGYQSIQASAGMTWADVKEKYGDKLTLWAGVQCETLIEGSPDDVEAEVTAALRDLMPGGGFIFGSTNSVQFGAKTDNYLKALDIVRDKGVYA